MKNLKTNSIWNIELNDKMVYILFAIYAFVLLFFCSTMSPLYPINDWSDINLYFTIGKAMTSGMVPYTDTFDHKGPLIFIIYAIGSLVSDTSFIGMFFIEIIAWGVMIFFAYRTAKLFLHTSFSFLVAITFPVLLLEHTLDGGSAEEFSTVAIVVSIYYFISFFTKDLKKHNPKHMFIHGMMTAIALFIKLNLIVFWFFPLLAIFCFLLINKDYKNLLQNSLAYISGVLAIAIPICIYFLINNGLGEAYNIYIELNKNYARLDSASEMISRVLIRFYMRLRFTPIGFIIILLGSILFPIRYFRNKMGIVGFILSFLSLFFVIQMSPNYVYYYSIPYYAFIIPGLIVLGMYLQKYIKITNTWHLYVVLTFVTVGIGICNKNFFGYSNDVLFRRTEKPSLLNQFSKVISEVDNPTLLALGLDQSAAIFTKCDIMPNVKYFITPNLTYANYPQMRDAQTQYIKDKRTDFIVLADDGFYDIYYKNLPALHENYILVDRYMYNIYSEKSYYLYKKIND